MLKSIARSLLFVLLWTAGGFAQTATPSPDGAEAPPASEIIDPQGNRWQFGDPHGRCPANPQFCKDINLLKLCNGRVYGRDNTGQWYLGTVGAGWTPAEMTCQSN